MNNILIECIKLNIKLTLGWPLAHTAKRILYFDGKKMSKRVCISSDYPCVEQAPCSHSDTIPCLQYKYHILDTRPSFGCNNIFWIWYALHTIQYFTLPYHTFKTWIYTYKSWISRVVALCEYHVLWHCVNITCCGTVWISRVVALCEHNVLWHCVNIFCCARH